MPLKNKLGHGILINTLAGSVGLTGILSGCAPMTPEETRVAEERMLGLTLGAWGDQNNVPVASFSGRLLASKNDAEAGRSEINIYNNSQEQERSHGTTVAEAYRNSPTGRNFKTGLEFKRKQLIDSGGIIMYIPRDKAELEDPFSNSGQIFPVDRIMAIGFLIPAGSDAFDYGFNGEIDNIDKGITGIISEYGRSKNPGEIYIPCKSRMNYSLKDFNISGEVYWEWGIDPQELIRAIGESSTYRFRMVIPNGDGEETTPYSRKFIIQKDN